MAIIQVSLHGKRLGLSPEGYLTGDGFKGIDTSPYGTTGQGFVVAPSPLEKSSIFDDFLAAVISPIWNLQKGSDGGATNYVINAQAGGVIRGVTGAGAGVSYAANAVQFEGGLNWLANKGGLLMEATVKPSIITTIAIFVGFTDKTTLEMPFTLSSGALTSNASDGCGFLFDTAATAATLKLVGVKANTDTTVQDTGVALSASVFNRLRVDVDVTGQATFFLNGAQVGVAMPAATTITTAMIPIVAAFTRTAGSANIDIDYILVQQNR